MRIALALLLACSGSPSDEQPQPTPAEPPAAEEPGEAALLKAGAPEPGPAGRAITKLAGALGLATARCPVDGRGRVTQMFGTPRDQLRPVGPTWMLELRPEDTKPWSPTYDVVPAEQKWVTVLAEPGSTGSYLRVGERTLKLTWPAANKGEQVTCSAVEPIEPRVVTGKVEPRDVDMWAVGCTEEPEAVASDGSFVLDAAVPCTLWLEAADAHRTGKTSIEPGGDKQVVTGLTWAADDIQGADRQFTDAGKAKLKEIARKLDDDVTYQLEALDRVEAELAGDDKAQKVVQRWRGEMKDWQRMTRNVHAAVEQGAPW